MPVTDLSEADKRINVESRLLEYLSRRGGQRIVAGPEMDGLVADLVNETYALAREGFLPPADDGMVAAAPPSGSKCQCSTFPMAGGAADCPNHVEGAVPL